MIDQREAHPEATPTNPFLIEPDRGYPATVGVVGAGTIGPDIAYFFSHTRPETDLVVVDIDEGPLESAEGHVEGLVEKGLRNDQLDPSDRDAILDIEYTTDYRALADADLVIEAVTEDLDVKRTVVDQVEAVVGPDCLITSNTSSIPAERIFADADRPERTTITHFFAPAWRNPVVELASWDAVDDDELRYLYWLFGALGKLPLVVEDEIAFMLDRVFVTWCNEAGKLLDQATAAEIDATAQAFVAAGPFAVLNLANGNPVHVEVCSTLAEENAAYRPANIFRSVESWNTLDPGATVGVSDDRRALIRERLLGVLFSQATAVIDREIGTPADLNLGCEAALGFRDGPFDVMADLGRDAVGHQLDAFAQARPGHPQPNRPVEDYLAFDRHLVIDRRGPVAVVTIRRPHRGNILSLGVFDELERALRRYEDDPGVEGVVLTGFGPDAFSSGWTIDSFQEVLGDYERSLEYGRECSSLFEYMEGLELPVVAALNGHALGAGFELAMRCHGIVAMADTYLQFPEATLGILPGIGGLVVPYRRWRNVPAATFTDMIRFAERLPTAEAADLGVVDQLADEQGELLDVAIDTVTQYGGQVEPLAAGLDAPVDLEPPEPSSDPIAADGQPLSPEVDTIICEGITEAAAAPTFEAALEAGFEAFARTATTDAAREGTTAFVERREPDLRDEA